MRTRIHTQPAECTEYYDGDTLLGATIAVRRNGRTVHMGEVRDWENEEEGYYPLMVGLSDDPDTLVKEIKDRARTYGHDV